MSFLGRLFGGRCWCGDEQPPSMPWDQRPSILEFLQSHSSFDKCGLTDGGESLPDEERINKRFHVRWAPGAMDGEAIQHLGKWVDKKSVDKTLELVLAYSKKPTVVNKVAIYQYLIHVRIVSIIDSVIVAVAYENGINHERLYELAYSFMTESNDREPVKFGIAILGSFCPRGNEKLFQTLGRHEEFTLFSAYALANASEDNDVVVWELARNVSGWGRIEAVKRLSETENPEIRDWLLREGFRNSVQYEHLAGMCARTGGLLNALSDECVDREMLTAAGEIIQALITGGTSEGIDDYEDGPIVFETYIDCMKGSAESVADFLHLNSIVRFLDEDDRGWQPRMENGWDPLLRESMKTDCQSILSHSDWPSRVRASLNSQDDVTFYRADQAAKLLGIDTWSFHWQRLQEMPLDSVRWFHVMSLCDDVRISEVINFAEKQLDLARIATLAGSRHGFGARPESQLCLDHVLQGLCRFAGHGRALIAAGLKSSSAGSRTMAVAALATSPRNKWPNGLYDSLKLAAKVEPDQGVRQQMRKALAGEPLSR